ncbi:radical SAM protein [Gorillibacterium sp. sgz5001074]|uniref:radical SAM protein n=1 Tax=Gorillibacterium sp. sgz5001074 TaxID=3446695 RepID=UPI003F67D80E
MSYKALERSKPEIYELEGLEVGVTSNCNFKCEYCCAYRRNDGQSLSGAEIIRVLEELPSLKRVRLSGGEVTLKFEDCLQVVDYCSKRGLSTQLNTNATLLNADRIRHLRDAGVSNIHISYNFTKAEEFAAYYGLPAALYGTILENIRLCVEAGIDTVLETLLFRETQYRMKEISESVYALGVRTHEIQNSIVMDHTGWNAISAREDLKKAMTELLAAKREDTTLFLTCMDRFAEQLGLPELPGVFFSHCVDGKKQLHLHGNGDILICELCHPVVIGNIYQGTSLKDIYTHKPAALADFLEKLPCPALDALFPEGV